MQIESKQWQSQNTMGKSLLVHVHSNVIAQIYGCQLTLRSTRPKTAARFLPGELARYVFGKL